MRSVLRGATVVRDPACPVCGSRDFEELHRQQFLLAGDRAASYTVASCRGCGFSLARDIPPPEVFAHHYASTSRYAYEGSSSGVPPSIHRSHADLARSLVELVRDHPFRAERSALRLLDVGASTGGFLSALRTEGFRDLTGLEPAPACRRIAQDVFGVEVVTASLESAPFAEPFDVVTACSVLEHLPDLEASAGHLAGLVAPGGVLFVQVPDAGRFLEDQVEPFLEFSFEHIVYFSRVTLRSLLAKFGFRELAASHTEVDVNGVAFPALNAAFVRGDASASSAASAGEAWDPAPLRRYVAACRLRHSEIEVALSRDLSRDEPVVVWGAGSLCSRLLATTSLRERPIEFFVDSNRSLHGSRLIGREIRPPEALGESDRTVLVASYVWADEIRKTLRSLGHRGRVAGLPRLARS